MIILLFVVAVTAAVAASVAAAVAVAVAGIDELVAVVVAASFWNDC